jgi:phosphatidylserine decarboxylase
MDLSYVQKASGFMVEKLSRLALPQPLSRLSVQGFANAFGLDMSEAEHPIEHYKTVADLFTRRLKAGARPLARGLAHVADGVLAQAGRLQSTPSGPQLIQAKGVLYSLADLIADKDTAHHYEGGSFLSYYLCPRDYHRVHQPWRGSLVSFRKIPGYLWPVNSWGVKNVPGLFVKNERVVMEFESLEGRFIVVMIGALNVGSIEVLFRPEVGTTVDHGQELGVFHLGSSVVVVYDGEFDVPETISTPQAVKVRSPLEVH